MAYSTIEIVNSWRHEFSVEKSTDEVMDFAKSRIAEAEKLSSDGLVKVGAALIKPDMSCLISSNLTRFDGVYPESFWKTHDSDPKISSTGLRKGDIAIHAEIRLVFNALMSGFVRTKEEWRECLLVLSTFPCAHCVSTLMEFTEIEFLLVLGNTTINTPLKQEKAKELLKWFNHDQSRVMMY
jgi:deoxycytidylate deaminase